MANVMVDLETLGTVPGCVLLSYGGVIFSTAGGDLGEELYVVFNRADCEKAGLHVSQDTLDWWMRQSPESRQVLADAADKKRSVPLKAGLLMINEFMSRNGGKSLKIWGNGADFDNPILRCAYHAADVQPFAGNYNGRCYRTAKEFWGIIGVPAPQRIQRGTGTHHNALDDAKAQAEHLQSIVAHYRSHLAA